MITNKDVRVENGNIVINGDKYPLDGQSPETIMQIVEDNSDTTPTENSTAPITSGGVFAADKDITDTIGDITQSGVTGATVAAQLGALDTTIGDITATGVTGADVASQLGALDLSLDNLNLVVHRFNINNAGASLLTDIDVNKVYTTGFIALASSHGTYNSGRISVYLGGVAYRKEDGTVGGIAATRLGSVGAGDGTDGDNLSFSIENDKLKLTAAQYQGATCVTIILSKHV